MRGNRRRKAVTLYTNGELRLLRPGDPWRHANASRRGVGFHYYTGATVGRGVEADGVRLDKRDIAVEPAVDGEVCGIRRHVGIEAAVHLDFKNVAGRSQRGRDLEDESGERADMAADIDAVDAHRRLYGRAVATDEIPLARLWIGQRTAIDRHPALV